ncbi:MULTISPECIES: hypothetical protein [Cyanophyceae]|uniref:hypothetical protein n=1 Tax=Cyanophyceae TaxID=3028117 RepID=UPI001681E683|nr:MULTISPECIES: hypothetical protein [Cyanophyceae]MBD1918544.1 hypothetical protein [Phormidium sp. FACHB-77]MBD2031433.1 hypothetical protein [Phormidium sp. FACHB-322]MBD2049552.1 hypothetical protein [Leptolyngbya sp. FACHB-60]
MSNYTTTELQTLIKAPMMTGLSVAMVDMGIVSTAIEAAAMSKQIAEAAQKYPANSIIQAAFSEETMKSGQIKLDKPDIKPEDVKSGAMIDSAIADISAALTLVEGKASAEEVAEYKQFIYDCGAAVAAAAGEGLFGTGSNKVSPAEAAALAKFKAPLGL